jgi:hypothetical protein
MNARAKLTTLATLTLAALTTTGAHAGIASVGGMTTWVTSPSGNCGLGGMAGFNAFAWDEQQNAALALSVDQTNNGPDSGAIPGFLSGTYHSHFIHWEPLPGAIGANGSVTYNDPIVGVMFTALNLDNSDAPAGHSSVTYPTTYAFRGIGGFPPSTINVTGNTISFNFQSFAPNIQVVQVRVLTRIPAPGSVALLGLGGLTAIRRRRR